MKHAQAIKIIKKCCDYYINKRLAFDANCFERGLMPEEINPNGKHNSLERKEIREAIKFLEDRPTLF